MEKEEEKWQQSLIKLETFNNNNDSNFLNFSQKLYSGNGAYAGLYINSKRLLKDFEDSISFQSEFSVPPKIVRILSGREPLSAGRRYEVTCQAASSRPSATIKWHIKSNTLSTFSSQTKDEGNITISSLQFTPKVEDNGKDLECIASVPPLPDLPITDAWKLDIANLSKEAKFNLFCCHSVSSKIIYIPQSKIILFSVPPRVTIRPGRSLNLNKIEENADVYFECEIHANPPVYKIIWYHQGKELHHNVSQGVIISNQSLVLQHVHKSASGYYSCKASNIEGDGVSSKIELTVKYKIREIIAPVCEKDQALFHGAAPNEKVDIPCYVDAHPKPESFTWTFNNSGESVNIPDTSVCVN
ncbi:Cell adhesion molecule 4 [Armadillidium nasatum]|uniref:Cell adhesion molecule 4 n=1 Tax=Armadillidium nasatum TaxID=96803 RepID=A0A5N5T0Q1_9CRUS|nr:Cell adhesion molecule 4 [Armadillidium nasatum]